jgi:hypothetical protein
MKTTVLINTNVYDDRLVPTVYAQYTIEKGDKNGKALDTNIIIS